MSSTAASLRRNAATAKVYADASAEQAATLRRMADHLRKLDPSYKDEIIGDEIADLYRRAQELDRDAEAQTERAARLERHAKASTRRNAEQANR